MKIELNKTVLNKFRDAELRNADGTPAKLLTDTDSPLRVKRTPKGTLVFVYRYDGKDVSIGPYGTIELKAARQRALTLAGQVANDRDPRAEEKEEKARSTNTVDHVLDRWIEHSQANGKRAIAGVARMFARHIRPAIGETVIYDLSLDHTVPMLDKIARKAKGQARAARRNLHAALNWWSGRDSVFNKMRIPLPPLKDLPEVKARQRALTDAEIPIVWAALEAMEQAEGGKFPALVRTLLLTGLRVKEVANMHNSEITGDAWTIPAARTKNKRPMLVTLSPAIRAVLPPIGKGFVFASDGFDAPFSGFSKAKARLDATIGKMPAWVLHDLRRTVRTNLSALNVPFEHAEAVLGHAKGALHGTYDLHQFGDEKAAALSKWAGKVKCLIHPSPDNLVTLRAKHRNAG